MIDNPYMPTVVEAVQVVRVATTQTVEDVWAWAVANDLADHLDVTT